MYNCPVFVVSESFSLGERGTALTVAKSRASYIPVSSLSSLDAASAMVSSSSMPPYSSVLIPVTSLVFVAAFVLLSVWQLRTDNFMCL